MLVNFDPHRLEPCADVIVPAAARRSILVGSGVGPPVPKNRRRPKIFLKVPEKISFYSQNFLMTFLLVIGLENCKKINTQQKWHRRTLGCVTPG